jgi:hypothetical protein
MFNWLGYTEKNCWLITGALNRAKKSMSAFTSEEGLEESRAQHPELSLKYKDDDFGYGVALLRLRQQPIEQSQDVKASNKRDLERYNTWISGGGNFDLTIQAAEEVPTAKRSIPAELVELDNYKGWENRNAETNKTLVDERAEWGLLRSVSELFNSSGLVREVEMVRLLSISSLTFVLTISQSQRRRRTVRIRRTRTIRTSTSGIIQILMAQIRIRRTMMIRMTISLAMIRMTISLAMIRMSISLAMIRMSISRVMIRMSISRVMIRMTVRSMTAEMIQPSELTLMGCLVLSLFIDWAILIVLMSS